MAGFPKLGVLPLDPLKITALDIGQGSGPVSIDLKFKDLSVQNLKTIVIKDVMWVFVSFLFFWIFQKIWKFEFIYTFFHLIQIVRIDFRSDLKNYKLKIIADVKEPLVLDAMYNMKGNVLILPLVGEGKCHLVLGEYLTKWKKIPAGSHVNFTYGFVEEI